MMNIGPVKRQRPNKSCTLCRKKKTKCDRVKPVCGSCAKRNQPDQCRYEDPEWTVKIGEDSYLSSKPMENQQNLSNSISSTNSKSNSPNPILSSINLGPKIGNQLPPLPIIPPLQPRTEAFQPFIPSPQPTLQFQQQPSPNIHAHPQTPSDPDDDPLDFYKNNYGEPTMLGQGIFTWVTLLKKDTYTRTIVMSAKSDKVVFTNVKNTQKSAFTDKFYVETGMDDRGVQKSKSGDKEVLNSIKQVVKDRKLVWLLIRKFFETELFCVFAMLDKQDFLNDLTKIIGVGANDLKFEFKTRIQFATVGILLIIMRLASLTPYNPGKNTIKLSEDDEYIMAHPLNKEVVVLAKHCFEEVSRYKDAHLITFQFNLLLVHYNFYAPEDCDCIAASATSNLGPLLHSAIALGLNRDPTISHPNFKNPELLRRLWYSVVYLDYYQTMLVGHPPMINKDFHDVELPRLDHNDSALNYMIHESVHERKKIAQICEPLLLRIIKVKEKPKIRDILNLLKPIEEYFENLLKTEDFFKIPSDSVMHNMTKLKIHNSLSDLFSLIFMIYYHLFLHYSEKQNVERSVYYCVQLLKHCNNLFPALYQFQKQEDGDFSLGGEFPITFLFMPKIELCLHKISDFMTTLLARVKIFKIFAKDVDMETLEIVDDIGDLLFKTMFFLIEASAVVSDTYYHSWCLTKILSFVVEKVLKTSRGLVNRDELSDLEKDYAQKMEPLIYKDRGFSIYSKQDLQMILNELRIIDLSSLGQTPSPERVQYDLNSYKIKNNQLWLDQLFETNFNPEQMQLDPVLNDMITSQIDGDHGHGNHGGHIFDLEQMLFQTARDF